AERPVQRQEEGQAGARHRGPAEEREPPQVLDPRQEPRGEEDPGGCRAAPEREEGGRPAEGVVVVELGQRRAEQDEERHPEHLHPSPPAGAPIGAPAIRPPIRTREAAPAARSRRARTSRGRPKRSAAATSLPPLLPRGVMPLESRLMAS